MAVNYEFNNIIGSCEEKGGGIKIETEKDKRKRGAGEARGRSTKSQKPRGLPSGLLEILCLPLQGTDRNGRLGGRYLSQDDLRAG